MIRARQLWSGMATWFEKLDRLREEFAVIDDLDVALEVWGLTPARFAALSSGAMFGLFVLLGWGFAWGVFAAVLTFPAVLVGLLAIQEAREKCDSPQIMTGGARLMSSQYGWRRHYGLKGNPRL